MRVALQPVDGVHVTTLIDNSCDALLPDQGLVRRWGAIGGGSLPVVPNGMSLEGKSPDYLRAEHGFSALVEVRTPGGARRVLFDAGETPDGLAGNLDRLAINPDTFEAVVFSHGHFDHVMGLAGVAARLGARNLPVLIHPDFWSQRRLVAPEGIRELPTPSRRSIEDAGFTVIEDRQPSFLFDGMMLVTGQVERTTDFEPGLAGQQALRDGTWQPDELVHDDQALVLHIRDKGLVVLTGCGHAGIINIVRYAKRVTGVDRVYAVLGGLHLRAGDVIPKSVAALAAEGPAVVVPAHCTSWRAQHALAAALGDAFYPNSVGSRFEL